METDIGTTEVKQVNFDIKPNDSPVNQCSPCNDVNKLNTPSSLDPTISREGEDKIGVLQKSLNYFSKLPIGMVGDTDAEDSSSSSESEEYMGITFDLEGFKAKRQMDGVKKTGHLKLTWLLHSRKIWTLSETVCALYWQHIFVHKSPQLTYRGFNRYFFFVGMILGSVFAAFVSFASKLGTMKVSTALFDILYYFSGYFSDN